MAITELLKKVDAAHAAVEEKRYAYEQASAAHTATVQDATKKLERETDAANAERDGRVQSAQTQYDVTVDRTSVEKNTAEQALAKVEAEFDVLRGQLADVLGMGGKPSRATVIGG